MPGGTGSRPTGRKVAELGFDEVFRRTWRFYLAYCEAGFASQYLGVSQVTFTRE